MKLILKYYLRMDMIGYNETDFEILLEDGHDG